MNMVLITLESWVLILNELTISNYITGLEDYCEQMADARINDNIHATKYNKLFKKRQKLIDSLHNNIEIAKEVYKVLLSSKNELTLVNVSANCLRLGILVDEAVTVLENIDKYSKGEDSFNAMMVLKVYRGEYPGEQLR